MRFISEAALSQAMSTLVASAHQSTDHRGVKKALNTMDQQTMRTAVLVALTIMTGEPVDTLLPFKPHQDA